MSVNLLKREEIILNDIFEDMTCEDDLALGHRIDSSEEKICTCKQKLGCAVMFYMCIYISLTSVTYLGTRFVVLFARCKFGTRKLTPIFTNFKKLYITIHKNSNLLNNRLRCG